jgi:D-xylonolactonase
MSQQNLKVINDEPLKCGEGPLWDVDKQKLYWTDALGTSLWEYDRATETSRQISYNRQAGSLVFHVEGGFVLPTVEDGFVHWKGDEDVRVVADSCDGKPVNLVNEITSDSRGRVFGGQEVYKEDQPYEPGYLYRVDINGDVSIVEEGIITGNGMGFSLDEATFYLVDSFNRVVYAYDYDVETGAISNRRDLVNVPIEEGLPDGLTIDSEGFLWVARWFGAGITRYDPDGKVERVIDFPVAQTSSVMFGGKDLNEIYVTSASMYWESPLAPPGHDYNMPRGGPTFRLIQDIQGRPDNIARV